MGPHGNPFNPISKQPVRTKHRTQNLFYKYQKLATPLSFRLLRIECRAEDEDEVGRYSLVETSFEDAPSYEALSYVWGSTERSETVALADGKFLRVTKLLKAALAFVEVQCATGYLWIDQVCIDQDDTIERGEQVKIMGQIYSSCERVMVWLGRMNVGPGFAEGGEKDRDVSVQKVSALGYLGGWLRKMAGSDDAPTTGILWHEIVRFSWFQRAWVFQEIVLPPSAVFILASISSLPAEALTMSLSDLHAMINHESVDTDVDNTVVDTIRLMYRRCNEQRGNHKYASSPIEQTLSLLAPRAKISEELDRLYAFFGLNFDPGISLSPSYALSLSEAMIDTTTSIIEGSRSLDIFEVIPRAVEALSRNADIPSWTPDFRKEHLVTPFRRSKSN